MKEIGINDLPKYSPWVNRLLGLEPFNQVARNIEKIDSEYDKDKYAKLLSYYESGHNCEDVRRLERFSGRESSCISIRGKLYLAANSETGTLMDRLLVNTLSKPLLGVDKIIELGAGYGYNLHLLGNKYPGKIWIGGEYSPNAVSLASRLLHNHKFVVPFNFYDDSWSIFDMVEDGKKALVFTCHAIEQLPLVCQALQTLGKYKNKISEVIYLEPVYELIDKSTTLGLMRQSYTRLNDYNTDLLSALKAMDVEVLQTEYDLLGISPLNPTSLIRWKFH